MLCSMTISFIGYDHSHAFIEFVLHRLSFKFVLQLVLYKLLWFCHLSIFTLHKFTPVLLSVIKESYQINDSARDKKMIISGMYLLV